jgi:CheY-like chemotaxis protein
MSKKSILVIEDDQFISDTIIHMLSNNNYNAHAVFNGKEAMNFLNNNHESNLLDCILLDFKMPIMGGVKFLHEFRNSNLKNKNMPIVVLTAYEDKQKWHAAGFTAGSVAAYLKKPLDEDNVLHTLDRIFNENIENMIEETDIKSLEKKKDFLWEQFKKENAK